MREMTLEPMSPTAFTSTDSERSIRIKPESWSSWVGGTDHVAKTKHPSLRSHHVRSRAGLGQAARSKPGDAQDPGPGSLRAYFRSDTAKPKRDADRHRRDGVVWRHPLGGGLPALGGVPKRSLDIRLGSGFIPRAAGR